MDRSGVPMAAAAGDLAGARLHAAGIDAQLAMAEEWASSARGALRELVSDRPGAAPPPGFGRQSVPRWHFAMLNDHERNDAFVTALERLIVPGMQVLDIGSGTGLLAMVAARAGAGHVTTCEANPLLAELARQVIAQHGLSDRITVVGGHSTALRIGRDLPRRADLLVSEIVDCGLVGEGILPTVRHARRELLRPDGIVVPVRGTLFGFLVESEVVRRLNHADIACGFDVSLMNSLATPGHVPTRLDTWPHRSLSESVELLAIDFTGDVDEEYLRRITCTVTGSGTVHGVAAWFELDLGAGVRLRNSPDNSVSHWMQAFVPLPEPLPVTAGDRVEIGLHCVNSLLHVASVRSGDTVGVRRAGAESGRQG